MTRPYPDISDIIARKEQGRRDLARLSFGEKIARMEALRERLQPMKKAREKRSGQENPTPPLGPKPGRFA